MASPRTRRLWPGYLAVTVLMTVARGVVAEASPAAIVITYAYPLLTIAAIAAGVRVHRPARRTWILGAATMVTGLLATVAAGGSWPVFPSAADGFWPACYPIGLAGLLLVTARVVGLVATVRDQAARLESIACLDALTGIPDRRAWDAELARRLAVAHRTGDTLIVALIGLDHFKRYRDLLGDQAGDDLLRAAGVAWQEQLRAGDLIARYGGAEFGLILHCPLHDASAVMDRLREVTPDDQTFSAAMAPWAGHETAEQLTARVDAALHTAKRAGRDRLPGTGRPARTDPRTDFLAGVGSYPR